ncbi:MAG: hypothetical protein PHE68_01115 [Candidatus Peribacteraceae bacterium]|nr:hypothetical protein [Candidatus Peribacteraceae bacterium]MDD5074422.1 hypothetical protein [Candidatus Peribacteraceae bacterium]
MFSKYLDYVPAVGALLLACLLGYLIGRIVTCRLALPQTPIALTEDIRPLVPTIRVDGIRNGYLEGSVVGDGRFVLGGHAVVTDHSGAFRVPAAPLLTNMITVTVPEGMKFVASKNGKKYYAVGSASAAQIAPINRIYFRTAEAAEQAGYQK